jgi:DNA-binding transcriptional regulator LsrR (DeoR family)
VIGINPRQLRKSTVVGIAGGNRKPAAILGALNGRWLDVLITDRWTAKTILAAPPTP